MNKKEFITKMMCEYGYEKYNIEYWIESTINLIKQTKGGITKEKLYDKTRFLKSKERAEFMEFLIENKKIKVKKKRSYKAKKPSTIYF